MPEAYVRKGGYSLHFVFFVFKNPKVDSKPPPVVPVVSNCQCDGMRVPHRGGYLLPPIVAAYRQLANGIDSANQLALEHRETGRFKCWSKALKAFLYRYVIVNTFTIARCQGLIPQKKSLWDFQWDLLESYVQKRDEVHAPVHLCTCACWLRAGEPVSPVAVALGSSASPVAWLSIVIMRALQLCTIS